MHRTEQCPSQDPPRSTSLATSGAALAPVLLCKPPAQPASSLQQLSAVKLVRHGDEGLTPTSSDHEAQECTPGCFQGMILPCLPPPAAQCGAHSCRAQGHPWGPAPRFLSPLPPCTGEHWPPPADIHASDAVQTFHNTDTDSKAQPDVRHPAAGSRELPPWPRWDRARDFPDPTETPWHRPGLLAASGSVQGAAAASLSPAPAGAALPTLWPVFSHCCIQTLFILFNL